MSIRARDNTPGVMLSILMIGDNGQEKKYYPLTEEQYMDMKPQKGPITLEQLEQIEAASSLCKTMKKGLNILSYSSHSSKELQNKLRQKGATAEDAKATAEYLVNKGYIHEEDDAHREVEKCLRKCWSGRRILAHLYEKGYTSDILTQEKEWLAEIDFSTICSQLIQKKYNLKDMDETGIQKMKAALLRAGFSSTHITSAIKNIKNNEDK